MKYSSCGVNFKYEYELRDDMWYHTFTSMDPDAGYYFSMSDEDYTEESAWEAINTAMMAKEDLNNDI